MSFLTKRVVDDAATILAHESRTGNRRVHSIKARKSYLQPWTSPIFKNFFFSLKNFNYLILLRGQNEPP
jgi:hypothetical protein